MADVVGTMKTSRCANVVFEGERHRLQRQAQHQASKQDTASRLVSEPGFSEPSQCERKVQPPLEVSGVEQRPG